MMLDFLRTLRALLTAERGQTMAEYAVVLAVITVVIVTALGLLAGGIQDALNAVTAVLP